MIRTIILLVSLSVLVLAQQVDADVFVEPFDAYVPGSGFPGNEPEGGDFQYVTDDGLPDGNHVAAISEDLGGARVLEIISEGGADNALRATSGTGFAQTFDGHDGHIAVIDLPGYVPPLGGPLATPLDLTGNTFSLSARRTAGPPVEIQWLLMSTETEVLGSTRFQLTSSFQVFEVSLSEFADDPQFGSFDVSMVDGVGWDVFLQSNQNDNVTTPIIIEIDDVASMPDPATLLGDLNDDSFVGQSDLDIVLAMWGKTGAEITDPRADVNEDDFVGQTDLDYVLADWGKGTPTATAIPEPTTLSLMGVGVVALARQKRK